MALPPLPPGFSRVEPTQRKRKGRRQDDEPAQALNATGQAHDGDTFRLSDGRNARLLGVDAFELDQTGRASDGSTVRLGEQARSALVPNVQPDATVTPNGSETYGRPVASVLNGDQDTGRAILHAGLGLSTPEYLRGDQQRLQAYTQEERLARLNRRGAFGGSFQTPKSFRQGNPDPWNAPQAGTEGNSEAVFWDDPTPFQGLKPEVEKGYIGIWQDMSSKPEDLIAYAKANGFQVNPDTVRKQYEARNRDKKAGSEVQYMAAPRVLTDLGDGRTGAALRGFADPINMLDEAGAVVDSLLPGSERENVWGSDRRFGDIYANNLEQNRSILANDDATHPYYRFGGQLASGLVTPGASVEGVGYAAARRALLEGSTRIAARSAARRAVLNRLALTGGIEGGLAGAGAGENTRKRVTGAAIGAPVGATLGVGLGVLAPKLAAVAGKPFSKLAGRDGEQAAGDFVDGALDTARARASNDAQDAANGIPDDLLQASPPLTGGRAVDLSAPHLNAKARKAISERKGLDPNISQFGPVHHSLSGKWDEALARMEADGTGDIPAAVKHPEAGNLDLVWGNDRYGVKRVLDEDPAAAERLPEIIASLPVREKPSDGSGRWVLENDQYRAVVSPDHNGPVKRWVVSSFDNKTLPPIDAEAGALPALPDGMQLVARERDVIGAPEASSRPRDRIEVGGGRSLNEGAASAPLDTSPPVRQAPPPRTMAEVQPEIDAWAAQRGARQAEPGKYPDVMLHGSPRADIQEFDPYGRSGYGLFGAGTYLTDTAEIAASYTGKGLSKAQREAAAERTLYAVRQAVKNPLDMDAPADRAQWEGAAKRVLGDWADTYFDNLPKGATNERYWREVEDILTGDQVTASEGQETMDALVRSLGHDGITHIGGGRVDKGGPRHRVVIALDPEQTEIVDRLSVGSLMNPPAPRSPSWIDANASARSTRARDRLDMTAAPERPTMVGPDVEPGAPRSRDHLDMGQRPRPLTADATDGERLAAADRLASRDVLPLPANTVNGVDEAARIEAGRYAPVKAGDEANTLDRRTLPNANTGTPIPKRGPADLVTWLRSQGGVKAQGGELAHSGIDNAPRKGMDFAEGEKRFGPLVSNDGMSYDEAAQRAWEAGYFPDHAERPTVNEFLDALEATHSGRNRSFLSEDLPEVDRFNAARQQRYDVERARDQGAPLSEDRSGPVNMADLDANAAPVTAYEEWGENAPNLAGNIRLDKLDSPQAIKRALTQTEQVTGGFDAARRGRITHAETESLASELGMTADDLLKRRKGQAFNAEEALAARQILARSATDLVNMAKRISRTENPGDEAEAAFREAWLRHAAIQEQVSGMTAEAGRALQQFRQTADARQVGRVLPSLGDIAGGGARLKNVADRIVDLQEAGTSAGGVNRFALQALRARKRDMVMEYYINALLSGPQTHATNILSNTLTSLAQLPEHAAAAAVGAVRQTGERVAERLGLRVGVDQDRVLFSEVPARFTGLIQGTKEGLRDAVRTFRTGDSPDNVTKVETQQYKAIPGVAGEIIRTPTRLLGAEDELFKGMARRMELTGLAMRMANREGLRGNALRQRAADLIENPTDEMLDKAQDYARYLTFQAPLGPVSSKIAGVSNSSTLMKFLIPFVRTPTNLLKFAVERSPAAPLLRDWRKEVLAGGARRDMAVARALVGTGIGAMFYEAALDGRITGGGPADESAKRLMLADGWQPYSVRVGDEYYSYRRLDPFSTTIGTMADMVDLGSHMTERQREKSGVLVTAAILNNLASKTWLTGVSGIAEALGDPDRYWQDFVSRTAGAVAVPALVAQVARTTDPVIREARAPMDRIRSRVPGVSDNLFPKRDVFGDPVESDGGVGPDIISPIWKSSARNDKTIAALVDGGVTVSAPARFRKVNGKRLEWTPAQYDQLQVAVGDEAKHRLDALVKSDDWKKADDDDRQSMVNKEMKAARTAGKALVEGGATQLVAKSQAKRPANDTPPLPPGYRLTDAPPLPAGMRMVN